MKYKREQAFITIKWVTKYRTLDMTKTRKETIMTNYVNGLQHKTFSLRVFAGDHGDGVLF